MPDRDKVISELELAASLAWNSDEGQCEIMDADDAMTVDHAILDALALLKEQEAQTVLSNRCCEFAPCRYTRKGFCPKCHQEVEWLLNRNYCGFCGQAVKWDG